MWEMDFARRIRNKQCKILNVESSQHEYHDNIKFYHIPPSRDINLEMLEDIVVDRLKVLHILEKTSGKNSIADSSGLDWKQEVLNELRSQKLFDYIRLIENDCRHCQTSLLEAREMDYISHFVLRFYYCDSDVLRQWFVDREMELFRLKLSSLTSDDLQNFLKANRLNYIPVDQSEVRQVNAEINTSADVKDIPFYKVRFNEVLNLVSSRECMLKGGYAYVNNLDSIIETIHRRYIEKGLAFTFRMMKVIREDERIATLLKTIHNSLPGSHSVLSNQTHNFIQYIDYWSTKSFPLCARMCHELLREKHHLKYFARNQYQLFLKGIGVSLEDSLQFWIEEFTHENKDKPLPAKYRYQIEYNYGKRGSKIDLPPPSCADLIAMNHPSFQQCYGCPYKFLDASSLKDKLLSHGLTRLHIDEILDYSNKRDYQLACTKYLGIVHGFQPNEVISNPNRYFELSQMVVNTNRKEGYETCSENKSMYEGYLWEMLSPPKKTLNKNPLSVNADNMSQLDLNF